MSGRAAGPDPGRSLPVRFPGRPGLELAGLLDGAGERGVAICSRFTGFKEERLGYFLARALGGKNILALRFDYGDGIGESGGRCEDMSVTGQIEDTLAAVDFLASRGCRVIGLFGHSLGGLTALAAASRDSRVRALVTAAASGGPGSNDAFTRMEPSWRARGHQIFPVWRRGEIRIPYAFYRDFSRYDGVGLIRKLKIPVRIIHPERDEIVSMDTAIRLYRNASEPRDLQIIPGADHLFSTHAGMEPLLSLSVDWFMIHLDPPPGPA